MATAIVLAIVAGAAALAIRSIVSSFLYGKSRHFSCLQPAVDKFPSGLYSHFKFFLYDEIIPTAILKNSRTV